MYEPFCNEDMDVPIPWSQQRNNEEEIVECNDVAVVEPVIKKRSETGTPSYRFKITIPQPFKLTDHTENKFKQDLKHAKHLQMKHEAEEKQRNDEIELLKQFRAKPIPVQTFLPLYDKITHELEQMRQANKEKFKMQLISQQNPFNLSYNKANKRRSRSVPELSSPENPDDVGGKQSNWFKATPAPKRRNYKPLSEITTEEEILREIRIKSRAEKLLKESALPFSSPRHVKKEALPERGRASSSGTKNTPATPKMTPRRAACPEKCLVDAISRSAAKSPSKYENFLKVPEQRRRSKSCSSHNANAKDDLSNYAPSPRMTNAAMLRESANRERINFWTELRESQRKKTEMRGINKAVLRTLLLPQNTSPSLEEKQQRFREADKAQLREYHKEIQQMKERVSARPFLIERQSQFSAVQKMEKHFREKLHKQGIDENFIHAHRRLPFETDDSFDSANSEDSENASEMLHENSQRESLSAAESQHSKPSTRSEGNLEDKSIEEKTDDSSDLEEENTISEIPERDCP